MVFLHAVDVGEDLIHVGGRSLDRGRLSTFSLPSLDVAIHLVITTLLLLYVVAKLADISFWLCLVDKLQATRLAHAVLFRALLAEVAPSPVATFPASLLKVAHDVEAVGFEVLGTSNTLLMSAGRIIYPERRGLASVCFGSPHTPKVSRRPHLSFLKDWQANKMVQPSKRTCVIQWQAINPRSMRCSVVCEFVPLLVTTTQCGISCLLGDSNLLPFSWPWVGC